MCVCFFFLGIPGVDVKGCALQEHRSEPLFWNSSSGAWEPDQPTETVISSFPFREKIVQYSAGTYSYKWDNITFSYHLKKKGYKWDPVFLWGPMT